MSTVGPTPPTPQSNFQINDGEATPVYSAKGKLGKTGKVVTRLKLNNDDRLNIAIRGSLWVDKNRGNLFKQIYLNLCFVKLDLKAENNPQSKESVYVNINSLASRLHISRTEIIQASNNGSLTSLIRRQATLQTEVFKQFEGIKTAYQTFETMTKATHLSRETLLKVIKASILIFENQTKDTFIFEEKRLLTKKHTIIANRVENRVELHIIGIGKKLGQGSSGYVSEAIPVKSSQDSSPQVMAYKLAYRPGNQTNAEKNLQMEYSMLRNLHSKNPNRDKPLIGIQTMPRAYVYVAPIDLSAPMDASTMINESGRYETRQVAYVGEKYDGDLTTNKKVPIEIKLQQGLELLTGLAFLAGLNIVHGDLKPENILVRKNPDGTILAHIADLAGATELKNEIQPNQRFYFPIHTACCVSYPHKITAQSAFETGDIQRSNQLLFENDVFALGLILFKHFTGQLPGHQRNIEEYVTSLGIAEDEFNDSQIPTEIQELLKQMLTLTPGKVPSAADALTIYREAMEKGEADARSASESG